MVAGVLGLSGFLVGGVSTYNYVQHDADFCTSCHIMDDAYTRWSGSVHSQVTCHECHVPNIADNLRQLWVYWTDPPDKPGHAPEMQNSTCYRCHRQYTEDEPAPEDTPGWQHVLDEAGHAKHVGVEHIQCIRCHSTSLHKFVPPEEICKQCHKHESLAKTSMDEHCTACHVFKAQARESLLPTRADCLECHKEMQVTEEIFPEASDTGEAESVMHWDCRECHKPHTAIVLEAGQCRECHEEVLDGSELHSVEEHAECLDCHKPHVWKVTQATPCLECHEDKADEDHNEGSFCGECHE
jgi:uncharacterized OB-fold protein